MDDLFGLHAELLAARKAGGQPPVDLNDPIVGWYRGNEHKDGPLVPIIIMSEDDHEWGGFVTQAFLNGRHVPIDRVWPFCAKHPVSKEWHDHYMQTGAWPDVHSETPPSDREAIGGNNPPTDPADVLRDQIEAAAAGVKDYATITDAEHAARAQSLRSRLTGLASEAETARKAEKEPHLKAGRDVDDKWRPIHEAAKSGADAIRAALSAWETAELRAAQEAAVLLGRQQGLTGATMGAVEYDLGRTKIKGGAGRAASGKTVTVVDTVTDWPALIGHFCSHETLKACARDLAERALRAGATVPGVTTKQIREVR
jgi:hypothetical protein